MYYYKIFRMADNNKIDTVQDASSSPSLHTCACDAFAKHSFAQIKKIERINIASVRTYIMICTRCSSLCGSENNRQADDNNAEESIITRENTFSRLCTIVIINVAFSI